MSRAQRLLALMQALRRRRRPVPAASLAEELGVSVRTIYRDVATLQAEGATIEGEAGLGYVLREGFFLPPLMLNVREADAVILGLQLARARLDDELSDAASQALAKIAAILPPEIGDKAMASGLLAGGPTRVPAHLRPIRQAMEGEEKLRLGYLDKKGRSSHRVVWPVALGFFHAAEVLAAWCETRRDFRHFRLDRIVSVEATGERLPTRRRILLAEWQIREEIDRDAY